MQLLEKKKGVKVEDFFQEKEGVSPSFPDGKIGTFVC